MRTAGPARLAAITRLVLAIWCAAAKKYADVYWREGRFVIHDNLRDTACPDGMMQMYDGAYRVFPLHCLGRFQISESGNQASVKWQWTC
jgi:hypothetical protein